MSVTELGSLLAHVNERIEQANQQHQHDALTALADQQHTLVTAIFAQLNGSPPDNDTQYVLQQTLKLNESLYQQLSTQKQQLVAEQFDLKRRAQATLHYAETEQL